MRSMQLSIQETREPFGIFCWSLFPRQWNSFHSLVSANHALEGCRTWVWARPTYHHSSPHLTLSLACLADVYPGGDTVKELSMLAEGASMIPYWGWEGETWLSDDLVMRCAVFNIKEPFLWHYLTLFQIPWWPSTLASTFPRMMR